MPRFCFVPGYLLHCSLCLSNIITFFKFCIVITLFHSLLISVLSQRSVLYIVDKGKTNGVLCFYYKTHLDRKTNKQTKNIHPVHIKVSVLRTRVFFFLSLSFLFHKYISVSLFLYCLVTSWQVEVSFVSVFSAGQSPTPQKADAVALE